MTVPSIALLCLALMTGNEFCVAAFVNPVLRKLPEPEQIPFLSRAASVLGLAMPFWYAASLALTAMALFAEHRATAIWPRGPIVSLALQVIVLVLTLSLMVPINNALGKLKPSDAGWTAQAVRWDHLHQLRVMLLLGAVVALAWM